ncbi:Exosome complex component RRP41 [Phytophthora pseudosyringae]|uniref:Exosome complex component RRP41 n=1 Tax=Phytophthora pseudosyringae TaxID=221518 RepID=A0A8T1WK66_9STRA|nr:Exosome complex component RRP41 [Phytophthora pseudosyringae]
MDRRSAPKARTALAAPSADAQENEEPVHVEIAAKLLVSASGPPVKAQGAKSSSPRDTGTRKLRRALHSVDSNRPRPAVNPPRHPLSRSPSQSPTAAVEAKRARGQAADLIQNAKGNTATEGPTTGHKRPATAAADEAKTPTGSGRQSEGRESENVAWMDMMLALLEKRYGSNASLPVCLTDLEAANMFQVSQRKKLKTGIASAPGATRSRSSLDAPRHQTRATNSTMNAKASATSSTNPQQVTARVGHEFERPKEDKRQRLLLRHAQQIQASSVSSSTSCGCKTGCLKMYCMCFSSRGFCHAGCACDDCRNGRKNQTERVEAIQTYLANDPRAFSFASLPQDANTTGFLHLLPQKSSAVVMRGCRCKKSKCLKKYCECFQNGIACTSHCRCMDCSNHGESTAALQHKSSATAHDKRSQSAGPKPFHPVHITVTKQPRRNRVGKTLRLNL